MTSDLKKKQQTEMKQQKIKFNWKRKVPQRAFIAVIACLLLIAYIARLNWTSPF